MYNYSFTKQGSNRNPWSPKQSRTWASRATAGAYQKRSSAYAAKLYRGAQAGKRLAASAHRAGNPSVGYAASRYANSANRLARLAEYVSKQGGTIMGRLQSLKNAHYRKVAAQRQSYAAQSARAAWTPKAKRYNTFGFQQRGAYYGNRNSGSPPPSFADAMTKLRAAQSQLYAIKAQISALRANPRY